MSSRRSAKATAFATLVLAATLSSAAPIVNGGFETGDFSGWTLTYPNEGYNPYGYAAVVNATAGGPVIKGNYSALLVTQGIWPQFYCGSDPWTYGCPSGVPIPFAAAPAQGPPLTNPLSMGGIINSGLPYVPSGPLLAQDIAAHAGDHLRIDWRWLSNDAEIPNSSGGDSASFYLGNGETWLGAAVFMLSAGCGSSSPVTGFRYTMAGCQIDLTIPFDGIWTLYMGVTNRDDSTVSSGIMVDSIRIPEPPTLALLALGMACIAFIGRRRSGSLLNIAIN